MSMGETELREKMIVELAMDKAGKVINLYDQRWVRLGHDVSAKTHYVAFKAARRLRKERYFLQIIERAAAAQTDYASCWLNFDREWALYFAEVKFDFKKAEAIIQRVQERRGDAESDFLEQLADGLAHAQIILMAGDILPALQRLWALRNRIREGPAVPDIEWWYFIAYSLYEPDYHTIYALAKYARQKGLGQKPARRWIWRLASLPHVGPRLVRISLRFWFGV